MEKKNLKVRNTKPIKTKAADERMESQLTVISDSTSPTGT